MNTPDTSPTAAAQTTGSRLTPAALWLSAVLLAALVIVQAGRLTGGSEARADLITGTGGLTALTVESTTEDVLLVTDNRSEQLMVFKTVNQSSLDLFKTYSLPRLFSDARNRASGGRR